MAQDVKTQLADLLKRALASVAPAAAETPIHLERPRDPTHGDFATNLAMQLAKALKRNPREIAQQLVNELPPSPLVKAAEIAGAGFINFRLETGAKTAAVQAVLAAGGKSSPGYTDAPGKGDYVWGELVLGVTAKGGKQSTEGTGTKTVLPGDIVQFRDAKFEGAKGNGTYSMTAPHHSAVVSTVSPDGKVIGILHQNWSGKRFVGEATLTLADLKGGWVKVYRPQPR